MVPSSPSISALTNRLLSGTSASEMEKPCAQFPFHRYSDYVFSI
jgi:hypothetical protein